MCSQMTIDAKTTVITTESQPNDALKTFAEIIEFRAAETPEKQAFSYFVDGEEEHISWDYNALKNAIAFVAATLNKSQIKRTRVVLLFEPGLAFIAAYLATISSGAIAVPSHPPMGKRQIKRLQDLIANCEPSLILYSDVIKQSTPQLSQVIEESKSTGIRFEEINIPMQPKEMEWIHPAVQENDIAMLQYTSASTGDPKGVMLTQKNLVKNSEAIYKWLGPHSTRKGCIWLPPYHDMGLLGGIMQPLYAGFPLVFMSPMHFVQQPLRWLKLISEHRLTTTGAPNFAFQLCVDAISEEELEEAELDLSCAREIFCGSEPINTETMLAFEKKFIPHGLPKTAINPCYGMAETTLFVSGKPQKRQFNHQYFDQASLDAGQAKLATDVNSALSVVSCGEPGNELDVRIVDPESHTELSDNHIGEVWVAGPSIASGYYNKTELNKLAFDNKLGNRQETITHSYYRTGDLGFYHADELYITGRIKDVIIIRGRNLYPQDIERCALKASEDMAGAFAAAFSVHSEDSETLIVVLEVKGRPKPDQIQALQDKVHAAVTNEFNVAPEQVFIGPQLTIPRTTSGKVQRFACKEAWLNNTLRSFKRSKS